MNFELLEITFSKNILGLFCFFNPERTTSGYFLHWFLISEIR